MDEHGSPGSSTLGYVLVLVGVVAFVLSCFLPYSRLLDQLSISYYRLAPMALPRQQTFPDPTELHPSAGTIFPGV